MEYRVEHLADKVLGKLDVQDTVQQEVLAMALLVPLVMVLLAIVLMVLLAIVLLDKLVINPIAKIVTKPKQKLLLTSLF